MPSTLLKKEGGTDAIMDEIEDLATDIFNVQRETYSCQI